MLDVIDSILPAAVEQLPRDGTGGHGRIDPLCGAIDVTALEAKQSEQLVGRGMRAIDVDAVHKAAADIGHIDEGLRLIHDLRHLAGSDDADAWRALDVLDEIDED